MTDKIKVACKVNQHIIDAAFTEIEKQEIIGQATTAVLKHNMNFSRIIETLHEIGNIYDEGGSIHTLIKCRETSAKFMSKTPNCAICRWKLTDTSIDEIKSSHIRMCKAQGFKACAESYNTDECKALFQTDEPKNDSPDKSEFSALMDARKDERRKSAEIYKSLTVKKIINHETVYNAILKGVG